MVDIQKYKTIDVTATPNSESKLKKIEEKKEEAYKAGAIAYASGQLLIPPGIQAKLNSIGKHYGVPFDLANITIGDGSMAEKVKALRTIVDLVTNDSKLLPEMLKLIKQLLQKDIKLAKFHSKLVSAATKHQIKLDKQVADICLTMAGFQATSQKRELKTNKRLKIIEARAEKYAEYYNDSVFSNEMQLIDLEIQTKTVNRNALHAAKSKRANFDAQRKAASIEYIKSAFE